MKEIVRIRGGIRMVVQEYTFEDDQKKIWRQIEMVQKIEYGEINCLDTNGKTIFFRLIIKVPSAE